MTKCKERLIGIAEGLSSLSVCKKYKFGAILVKGSRIISRGINKPQPKPFYVLPYREGDFNLHSEVDCLRFVPKDKSNGCDMYVVGIGKGGSYAKSKPCPSCQMQIKKAGIRRVFYMNKDGTIECLKFS